MAKRIFYSTEQHLKQMLNIPEECKIVQILHDHKTDEIEFIIYSSEEVSDENGKVTFNVQDANSIRRKQI